MEQLVHFFRSVETQTDIVYPAPLPPLALPVFTALSPHIYPSLPAVADTRSIDLLTLSRRRVDIVDDNDDLNKMPGYLSTITRCVCLTQFGRMGNVHTPTNAYPNPTNLSARWPLPTSKAIPSLG